MALLKLASQFALSFHFAGKLEAGTSPNFQKIGAGIEVGERKERGKL